MKSETHYIYIVVRVKDSKYIVRVKDSKYNKSLKYLYNEYTILEDNKRYAEK